MKKKNTQKIEKWNEKSHSDKILKICHFYINIEHKSRVDCLLHGLYQIPLTKRINRLIVEIHLKNVRISVEYRGMSLSKWLNWIGLKSWDDLSLRSNNRSWTPIRQWLNGFRCDNVKGLKTMIGRNGDISIAFWWWNWTVHSINRIIPKFTVNGSFLCVWPSLAFIGIVIGRHCSVGRNNLR